MKPYWNLVKNKVAYMQISECKGCGRVHKRELTTLKKRPR